MSTEFSPGYLRMAAKQTCDDKGSCADVTNPIVKGWGALESVPANKPSEAW